MAITQTITSVEQDGGNHSLYNVAEEQGISPVYSVCIFLIVALIIYCVFRLLDNAITKTCMGCKRLKSCEKRLKELEKQK